MFSVVVTTLMMMMFSVVVTILMMLPPRPRHLPHTGARLAAAGRRPRRHAAPRLPQTSLSQTIYH